MVRVHANRGLRLRQIIKSEGLISRPPTTGEREALETGLDALDIPRDPTDGAPASATGHRCRSAIGVLAG